MKEKTKSFKRNALAAFIAVVLALVGLMCGTVLHTAKAEDAVNYDYWHISEGSGTYQVSLNTATRGNSGIKGIETVVTRTDSTVKDMSVTLNGSVSPVNTSSDPGKVLLYFDNQVNGVPDAEAIVVTFTSMKDCTKQLSIIGVDRGNNTRYTVAFTDDITVKDGYAYVDGKKTVGSDGVGIDGTGALTGVYSDEGTYITASGSGAIYNGDVGYFMSNDGVVYANNGKWTKFADIDSEEFLNASKANLGNSKYATRYTEEYAQSLIDELKNGCAMTIKWFGLKTDSVDFHIRGITGFSCGASQSYLWIDGTAKGLTQWDLRPVTYQKVTEVYKYKSYNVQDLIAAYTFPPTGAAANPAGFWKFNDSFNPDTDTPGTSNSEWYNYLNNPSISFDKDNYIYISGSVNTTHYFKSQTYKFKVIDSSPVVTAKSENVVVAGEEYDLTKLFGIKEILDRKSLEIKVDGTVVESGRYTFDAEEDSHTVTCTVTDTKDQVGMATAEVTVFNIETEESVTLEKEEGDLTYFAAPLLPENSTYTVKLFNKTDDVDSATPITTDESFEFKTTGEYKLVYTITLNGVDAPVVRTTEYNVTVVQKAPEITVTGEYEESYFVGMSIEIFGATANNGKEDFDVTVAMFRNDESVGDLSETFAFTAAGEYELVYSVAMTDGRTIEKRIEFTVEADTEKPVIVVNGVYAESYYDGMKIRILAATAVDNTGIATLTRKVFFNGAEQTVEGDELTLAIGSYKIVYSAVDPSGNAADEKVFEFNVVEKPVEGGEEDGGNGGCGCNGCGDGKAALGFVTIAMALGFLFIKRR